MQNNNFRIFVSRFAKYDFRSTNLLKNLQLILNLKTLKKLNIFTIYDLYNIDADLFNDVEYDIFARKNIDTVTYQIPKFKNYLAFEPLPLQFDKRSMATKQLLSLFQKNKTIDIKVGTFIGFNDELSSEELSKIKKYLINPIESQEKNLTIIKNQVKILHKELSIFRNFSKYNQSQLQKFLLDYNYSLHLEDALLIQDHYRKIEKRDPNLAELMLFNIYWSDHCRHTTFNTKINNIQFLLTDNQLKTEIQNTYNLFKRMHYDLKKQTSFTLMDLSLVTTKQLIKQNQLLDLEKSAEINAISIEIKIKDKEHYLIFKNETHNHPSEIEPYGGSSTCLGGAMRDIFAARGYCFGGMRLSGCGNILEDVSKTIPSKLPQIKIARDTMKGFSSYGNQVGLPTLFVNEYYHDSYKAKHLECGAVLGIVPKEWVIKKEPKIGDLIVLVGGKTGIDGIGGASGSSKSQDHKSLTQSAAEVQKGNPIIARKLQRLFNNHPQFTKLIKRCNDFGAGGASVAIGELAKGIIINLDKFKTKYLDIKPYEILFSESQERMAMVIEETDLNEFTKLINFENLDAYSVGKITNNNRLQAYYNKTKIIDIDYRFLNSNGAIRSTDIIVKDVNKNIFNNNNSYKHEINKLKNMSQKGLVENFDHTIGAVNLLNNFGGKYHLTKNDILMAKIPSPIVNESNLNVAVTTGFNVDIAEKSAYHMGYYSILETISKMICKGITLNNLKISLQEYFPTLSSEEKWSQPFLGLLGAFKVLNYFNLPVVGGKDSMSGSFNKIDVIPTLISFGINTFKDKEITINNVFKKEKAFIYMLNQKTDANNLIDLDEFKANADLYYDLINKNKIIAAMAITSKNLQFSLIEMALGNKTGFNITYKQIENAYPANLLFQTKHKINNKQFIYIGSTNLGDKFQFTNSTIKITDCLTDLETQIEKVYPTISKVNSKANYNKTYQLNNSNDNTNTLAPLNKRKCVILHPIFPGTNCEIDVIRKFNSANNKIENKVFVFLNQNEKITQTSIKELAKNIKKCDILNLSGGFSLSDEPDGSAKYLAVILKQKLIAAAIQKHLKNKKLILGVCNGFQALIQAGLLPYENLKITKNSPALINNPIGKHLSKIIKTKYLQSNSPWISNKDLSKIYNVPISHGEGCFKLDSELLNNLIKHNQVASVYVNSNGDIVDSNDINPNNSNFNVEGILSKSGLILGKMAHSERVYANLYLNCDSILNDPIFNNGIKYILGKFYSN